MPIYALTNDQAIALAKQKANGHVKFIAIDYNWGAPISGRFDTDWMRIWGVSIDDPEVGTLYLYGTKDDYKWDVNIPFAPMSNLENPQYFLYYLELNRIDFPVEFVLRFDRKDGTSYYDNNNEKNYRILNANQGRGLSGIGTAEAIFDFESIIPCHLYFSA